MYTGAAIGSAGWFLSSEGMAFCGLMLAALGTAGTIWFKVRDDRRAVREERRQIREHDARMAELANEARKGRK